MPIEVDPEVQFANTEAQNDRTAEQKLWQERIRQQRMVGGASDDRPMARITFKAESANIRVVRKLVSIDADKLAKAEQSYGDSWKERNGAGAFFMLARKWDRINNQCEPHGFHILKAIAHDPSPTGIIDDIRDLRRYLLLVEAEMVNRGVIKDGPA